MGILYKTRRIGKNRKEFVMYKLRTLKMGSDKTVFTQPEQYTWCGRFLRKYKIDELPQLWNIIKRDMNVVGPRPEEKRTFDNLPTHIQSIIINVRPGLTDLASLFFFDEEKILQYSDDIQKDYWEKIKPIKFILQCFYVEHKCLSLDLWIIWQTIKKIWKHKD